MAALLASKANSALVRRYRTFVDTGLSSKTAGLVFERTPTTTLTLWVCSASSAAARRSASPLELAQFIDEQSAFLVQKGIHEYSRARAGHYAKVLFKEPEFHDALERSRWTAYPAGARHGRRACGGRAATAGRRCRARPAARDAAGAGALGVRPLSDPGRPRRGELEPVAGRPCASAAAVRPASGQARLRRLPGRLPKPTSTSMPIHRQLRASEFPTLHSYLKVTLCNIHDELTKRLDGEAIVDSLRARDG